MTIFSRSSAKNFLTVAIAVILCGVVVLVVGIIQALLMSFTEQSYGWPAAKVISGLVVIALGYIMLELELIRLKQNK